VTTSGKKSDALLANHFYSGGATVVGWLMNIISWPWHLILQWSGGLSALAVVGVTLNALHRGKIKATVR
jgi:hypothetical protein